MTRRSNAAACEKRAKHAERAQRPIKVHKLSRVL
jgi:hypothetical protein